LAAGELDEPELLPEFDDEPHADAAATHAIARTPIHALCSFMAKVPPGRSGRPGGREPPAVTEVSFGYTEYHAVLARPSRDSSS
jgi:hypothetical protein